MKLAAIVLFLLFLSAPVKYTPNPVPVQRHKFIVIAHRGDHTIYPENTLQGYGQAIKNDADYVEVDVRTTSDGQLISLHDASVNRMTNGTGLVKDLTLEQIENLRISLKNNTDTTRYRIPAFKQILQLCKNRIYIYIDFKEASAAATYSLLKQHQMEKQVLVYINKPSQFADWRKTDASMPLMVSLPDSAKTITAMQNFVNQYHPDVLDGDYTEYNSQMLTAVNALGLTVWPDAQSPAEGPAVWDKAISIGFKGLQTDNPPALIKYLEQKGLR